MDAGEPCSYQSGFGEAESPGLHVGQLGYQRLREPVQGHQDRRTLELLAPDLLPYQREHGASVLTPLPYAFSVQALPVCFHRFAT